jgi:hypothetical protein
MEKKNVVKRGGKVIALTVALISVFALPSCKKDAAINPENSPIAVANQSKIAVSSNYKVSRPISLNGAHDITISGDSISGGSLSCISLANCHNIHITKCKLVNSSAMGVNLSACSNIIIDDCNVANVSTGVYSYNGNSISVMNNKMAGIQSTGATVTFENVSNDVANDAPSNSAVNNVLTQ